MTCDSTAARARLCVLENDWKPRNCVWELTLACNLRCGHCGSRAGRSRPNELTTVECLHVVDELGALGGELVTLSGGEPTLRRDWDVIARAVSSRGMLVNMVTNGVYNSPHARREVAARAKDAGMCNVGVSIDGPLPIHEEIRGKGTFEKSTAAIDAFCAAGLKVAVLTTLNQRNVDRLDEMAALVAATGASQWRFQLAKPMGTMSDHRDLVLRPEHLLYVIPKIAELKKRRPGGLQIAVGDSIGYYGPYDRALRGRGWRGRAECWKGCQAGMQAIGIEADGGVKGCLSLQAKWGERDPFVEANLREASLDEIWHRAGVFPFNREFKLESLTGACAGCEHGQLCRGGARCVAAAVTGGVTENPYCYHALAIRHRVRHHVSATESAAAAAAAMLLSLGSGCYLWHSPSGDRDTVGAGGARDAAAQDAAGGGTPDAGNARDSAVSARDASNAPDSAVSARDASNAPDSAIDCSTVCCDCDYGTPPPEECCPSVVLPYGVTPCEDTPETCCPCGDGTEDPTCCVMLDYGVIPNPCTTDAGCADDYGVDPPDSGR